MNKNNLNSLQNLNHPSLKKENRIQCILSVNDSNGNLIKEKEFSNFPIKIGSKDDSDFYVPIDTISNHHAEISCVDGNLIFRDLLSVHGSFFNGLKVEMMTLRSTCKIQLGTKAILKIKTSEILFNFNTDSNHQQLKVQKSISMTILSSGLVVSILFALIYFSMSQQKESHSNQNLTNKPVQISRDIASEIRVINKIDTPTNSSLKNDP